MEILRQIDFTERILPRYLGLTPWFLVFFTGIVVAAVHRYRSPGPAWCVFVSCCVLLFTFATRPILFEWILERSMVEGRDPDSWLTVLSWTTTILDAAAVGLLLVAAFGWRRGAPQPFPAAATATGGLTVVAGGTAPAAGAAGAAGAASLRPIDKGATLSWIYIPMVIGALLSVITLVLGATGDEDALPAIFGTSCLSLILMVVGVVMLARLLYKMWTALQGGVARTTPGKAVGFLFIPFFNFYWLFVAYRGWALDCNATLLARGISAPRAGEGVALALCIFALIGMIPYVGLLFSPVSLVLGFLFFSNAIDCVNAMVRASEPARD